MGPPGRSIVYPTIEDIINLNRDHIHRSKGLWVGTDNLSNRASLEWVLEAIQYPLFGKVRYESLSSKAAMLTWVIINDHVFFDACKRTAMSAMIGFIRLNGYPFNAAGEEIIDMAVNVADHTKSGCTVKDLERWIGKKSALNVKRSRRTNK